MNNFQLCVPTNDYGDAPASYDSPMPASHVATGPRLGATRDAETTKGNGFSGTFNGTQDDTINTGSTDDEDGVTFSTPAGGGDNIIAQVVVTNNTSTARLCGWLDGGTGATGVPNGTFDLAERQCTNVTSGRGTVNLEWLVNNTNQYTYYARFRVCTTAAQCESPTGTATDGEVEDHVITYNPTLATVGGFEVKSTSVDDIFAALAGENGDTAALLALLAGWDPELAASLKDADAETIAAALRWYLDPDGDGNVALVRWDTLQEHGTIGFYAERAEGDGWTRLNGGLLPGLIDAPQGGEYWLLDPDVTAGTHRYRLVELEAWGSERLHGPWEVQIGAVVAKASTAGNRTLARTVAQPTNDEENTEFWSDWRGLAQGFAARKRVPPPPPAQPMSARTMAKAAPATTPTGALWLRTQAEGLYQIPAAHLAELLGEKEDQIRKWLNKEKKLALVNAGAPTPWYYDEASDALYFVAQEYRTLHTDENAYHLAKDNAQSLTMGQRTGGGPASGSAGAFRDTLRLEQDLTYSLWSVTDDTEADYWFWDYLYAGTKARFRDRTTDPARRGSHRSRPTAHSTCAAGPTSSKATTTGSPPRSTARRSARRWNGTASLRRCSPFRSIRRRYKAATP